MATITSQVLIQDFLDGKTEGRTGTRTVPGNLWIQGEQLIHFKTPIAERNKDKIIINTTRYSIATGKIQKMVKEMAPPDKSVFVKQVPSNKKISLKDYIEE